MNEALPKAHPDSIERMQVLLDGKISGWRRSRKTRRKVAAFTAGGALVVATSGGALAFLASQQLQDRSAYCYAAPDPNVNYSQVGIPDTIFDEGTGESTPVESPSDRSQAAVEMCQAVWNVNVLDAPRTAKHLVACVRSDNVIAVFPTFEDGAPNQVEVCMSAGMPPAL